MKRHWWFGLGAAAGAAAAGAAVAGARRRALDGERVRRLQGIAAAHGKNIVILGAGFGGINAVMPLLRALPPESGWRVSLVDRNNYFVFTPLLYHAATGLVDPTSILFPVRSLTRQENFIFREGTVRHIDFQRQVVHLDDGQLPYDYLVIGLGSVPNFFGKQEELRHAITLKRAGDAITIRNRIIDAYERADVAADPEERRRLLTFAVVGGGATGVELMGAIRGLAYGTLAQQYPRIDPGEVRLLLFEALPEILPGLPRGLAHHALNRLRELGVDLRLECPVERVDQDGLTACNGEFIPSRTVIWTAGIRPPDLARDLQVPKTKNGRIEVNAFLQVPGFPGVYALGDIAGALDAASGKPLPPNAAVAVRQGRAVAENILADLDGGRPAPFAYQERGELVSLGKNEAVAEIGGVCLTGFPAWVVWRTFYLAQLMGFRNKMQVALDWTVAYVHQRDTVRLDVPCEPSPEPELPEAKRKTLAA
jgi:NADH dehydrogenase